VRVVPAGGRGERAQGGRGLHAPKGQVAQDGHAGDPAADHYDVGFH